MMETEAVSEMSIYFQRDAAVSPRRSIERKLATSPSVHQKAINSLLTERQIPNEYSFFKMD
jgi:hypothetical protein